MWRIFSAYGARAFVLGAALLALGAREPAPTAGAALSAQELEWIRNNPVVKVGFSPTFAPYSMPDPGGRMEGIDLDYLNLIARHTGLKFEPVVLKTWPDAEAAFAAGRVDLLTALTGSPRQREQILLSDPYLLVPTVIISRTDSPYLLRAADLRDLTIGAVKGYPSEGGGPNDSFFAQSTVREYPDMGSLLEAVARGEVEATATDSVTAAYYIRTRHLTNLRLGSVVAGPSGLFLGVPRAKPELHGIINKAIAAITNEEKRAVDNRWIMVDVAPSRWLLAFKVAAVLTAAALVALLLLYVHERRLTAELQERRRVEAELRDRTAELAARVAEVERLNQEQRALMRDLESSQRLAEQSAARWQQANANLLAANQELDAFSYSISHDLRAPLRNIRGFVELAGQRSAPAADPELTRFMGIITGEVERMGHLIDDLLTFSRIGRTELQFQPVDLDSIVAAVRAELATEIGTRRITWRLAPLPKANGDPALIRQVFLCLLSNAVKFTRPRAEAVIEIGARPSTGADSCITCFIRDNGVGFDPKHIGKLFGVFQRLHSSRAFEGTGIGLANVKRIVNRHGGRVWAEGQVEHGATFHFTLMPAVAAPNPGA